MRPIFFSIALALCFTAPSWGADECPQKIFQARVKTLLNLTVSDAASLDIVEELDGDSYAPVYLARDKGRQLFVLKLSRTENVTPLFAEEVRLAVRAGEAGVGPRAVWVDRLALLKMDYAPGATFEQFMHTRYLELAPSAQQAWLLLVRNELLKQLDVLHRMGIAHGAVDGRHVYVNENGRVLLLDFSRAAELQKLSRKPYAEDRLAALRLVGETPPSFATENPSALRRYGWRVAAAVAVPAVLWAGVRLNDYLWSQAPTPPIEIIEGQGEQNPGALRETPAHVPPGLPFSEDPQAPR